MNRAFCVALTLCASFAFEASAAVILDDDFSSYGSTTTLNAPDSLFAGVWRTTAGTVDYIRADSSFGTLCRDQAACIDLDGTSGDAGVFETVASFAPGLYRLDFTLFGSLRGDTNTVTVRFGDYLDDVTLTSNQGLMRSVMATVGPAGSTLSFANAGGDNLGAILARASLSDEGGVTPIPLPAGAPLLLGGLAAFGLLRIGRGAG